VACSEPSFEDAVAERVAEKNIEAAAVAQIEAEATAAAQAEAEARVAKAEAQAEAIAYINRGIAHRGLGQYELAIQSYDEAIRLDPQFSYAYNSRGIAYEALGNSIQAEQDFAKAKELGYRP